jgi:hypothetical protein
MLTAIERHRATSVEQHQVPVRAETAQTQRGRARRSLGSRSLATGIEL